MAAFYQANKDICVSDVTSKPWLSENLNNYLDGKKVQIKITEYGPDMLKFIRR